MSLQDKCKKHGYMFCMLCNSVTEELSNAKTWTYRVSDWSPFFSFDLNPTLEDKKESLELALAVQRDIDSLTQNLKGWKGKQELPEAEKDLTSYRDAYESARENCDHENTTELLWHKEYKCEDCQKIVGYKEVRKGWFM